MALSLKSEAGPRLPEMISADNPNSSVGMFNGKLIYSEADSERAVCVPGRREIS